MLLGNLVKFASKKYSKIPVKGISFDSRKVKKKDIFFAIKGKQTSGFKFVNEAISRGASAIISSEKKLRKYKVPLILAKDTRNSLAAACSQFYKKKPSNIIAVTGTNGKSSVADFFYQILSLNKVKSASIGTLGVFSKNYKKKTKLTSMDPLSLHKNLEVLSKNKIKHVILEASSHGLEQKRLDNLNINTGIFTNLSHDHLDYHKNMNSYFNSKMYLFRNLLKSNSTIISDTDIKEFKFIKNIADKRKIKINSIGFKSGTIKILSNKYVDNKQVIKILFNSKNFQLTIPLIGFFQIKNLLMAVLAALKCGLSYKKIFNQLHKIKSVDGRLELVSKLKNNSIIVVDFAHTPDALKQTLIAIKKQFKGEIVIVFGCGGERDKKKRLHMGRIANKYCRKIIVTDDNPRNENPKKIRKSIIKGCKKKAISIGNRKKAINIGIKELRSNEILLIAGKGHEKTQDYGNREINFSDKKVAKQIISKRKFYFKKSNYQNLLLKNIFDIKDKNVKYTGVSINTKTLKKNNLFFAIKGKKTDGHNFVKQAIKKGAIRCIVSKKIKNISKNKIIRVKNTFSSLNDLAKITRHNTTATIIGITGSVGKTTLKNLVSFTLKNYGKAYQSPYSYNNKFGVPFSISNLSQDTKYGIFEIGMDKKGEIDKLSKIVKPEIAVITNISEAHIKNFNTTKDIARAKAEIINNIQKGGKIILNKDEKFFNFFSNQAKKNNLEVISFSISKKANIRLLNVKKIKQYFKLKIKVNKKIFYFKTLSSTNNFLNNTLACISIITALNLDLKKIKNKFTNFSIPSGRGDIKLVHKFKKKFKFVDESYNANPLSMRSAIKNMKHYKTKNNNKKLVFLGDMLELGKKSKKLHKNLSFVINRSDIDQVFVYGNYIKETFKHLSPRKKGKVFNNLDEAYKHLGNIIHNNDLLMVKGSNATGLNKFSQNIKKDSISAL